MSELGREGIRVLVYRGFRCISVLQYCGIGNWGIWCKVYRRAVLGLGVLATVFFVLVHWSPENRTRMVLGMHGICLRCGVLDKVSGIEIVCLCVCVRVCVIRSS